MPVGKYDGPVPHQDPDVFSGEISDRRGVGINTTTGKPEIQISHEQIEKMPDKVKSPTAEQKDKSSTTFSQAFGLNKLFSAVNAGCSVIKGALQRVMPESKGAEKSSGHEKTSSSPQPQEKPSSPSPQPAVKYEGKFLSPRGNEFGGPASPKPPEKPLINLTHAEKPKINLTHATDKTNEAENPFEAPKPQGPPNAKSAQPKPKDDFDAPFIADDLGLGLPDSTNSPEKPTGKKIISISDQLSSGMSETAPFHEELSKMSNEPAATKEKSKSVFEKAGEQLGKAGEQLGRAGEHLGKVVDRLAGKTEAPVKVNAEGLTDKGAKILKNIENGNSVDEKGKPVNNSEGFKNLSNVEKTIIMRSLILNHMDKPGVMNQLLDTKTDIGKSFRTLCEKAWVTESYDHLKNHNDLINGKINEEKFNEKTLHLIQKGNEEGGRLNLKASTFPLLFKDKSYTEVRSHKDFRFSAGIKEVTAEVKDDFIKSNLGVYKLVNTFDFG
jgi:hypothetical protein